MHNLFSLDTKNTHVSSKMLMAFEDGVNINGDYIKVLLYLETLKTIQKLGWVEHTCDWDLNTIITTNDGRVFETEHGYGDCLEITLNGEQLDHQDLPLVSESKTLPLHLTFDADQLGDDDLETFSILITEIHSLTTIR